MGAAPEQPGTRQASDSLGASLSHGLEGELPNDLHVAEASMEPRELREAQSPESWTWTDPVVAGMSFSIAEASMDR